MEVFDHFRNSGVDRRGHKYCGVSDLSKKLFAAAVRWTHMAILHTTTQLTAVSSFGEVKIVRRRVHVYLRFRWSEHPGRARAVFPLILSWLQRNKPQSEGSSRRIETLSGSRRS